MRDFFKRNLYWFFCSCLSLLGFILLASHYLVAVIKYDESSGFASSTGTASGYDVMRLWQMGFAGSMSSIIQIVILLSTIALLILGIIGFLKEYKIIDAVPDQIGKFSFKLIYSLALVLYGALNILLLVFLLITAITSGDSFGTATIRYHVGAGMFIMLGFNIGSIVLLTILEKEFYGGSLLLNMIKARKSSAKEPVATENESDETSDSENNKDNNDSEDKDTNEDSSGDDIV